MKEEAAARNEKPPQEAITASSDDWSIPARHFAVQLENDLSTHWCAAHVSLTPNVSCTESVGDHEFFFDALHRPLLSSSEVKPLCSIYVLALSRIMFAQI